MATRVAGEVNSVGGWLEIIRPWSLSWESHFGEGIDDPADEDSLTGRVQNQVVFGNLIWQVTEELSTGCEIGILANALPGRPRGQIPSTQPKPSTPGEAITVEWMVRYDF